jgi:hypothetical protein
MAEGSSWLSPGCLRKGLGHQVLGVQDPQAKIKFIPHSGQMAVDLHYG